MDTTQSITNGSQASLFANKIVKDTENLEIYYQRMLNRFRACCSCMKNLFTPLRDESIVKIRPMEIVKFLNRIFMFDFKRLVIIIKVYLFNSIIYIMLYRLKAHVKI